MYKTTLKNITLHADPERLYYAVETEGSLWEFKKDARIELSDGRVYPLSEGECVHSAYEGLSARLQGVKASYRLSCGITVHTAVGFEGVGGDIVFQSRVEGEEKGMISRLVFPGAVDFGKGEKDSYTVLPRMQGEIFYVGSGFCEEHGRVFEREAYMAMFGQLRRGEGYLAVYDTPYDARYIFREDAVEPFFIPSLGLMAYPRRMLYRFGAMKDYNDLAKLYRKHVISRGNFVTLKEKIARNPKVGELMGLPIVNGWIATHISPESEYYSDNPAVNDRNTTFEDVGKKLAALKEDGIEKAYVHLDGWGLHGYDNLHTYPFPPHEAAGGEEGMRKLSEDTRALGYLFGIHDQYRDYYYDAPDFDIDNAMHNADGGHPFCSIWYGGPHSWLCAKVASEFVRRNYDWFEEHGIELDGSYLDVFSVVELDECFSPDHPMTRRECAEARSECLAHLTSRGIIPSSEETLECILPSQVLSHHAPYFTQPLGRAGARSVGRNIPLFNLVYHDCVVIPWYGDLRKKGGWGIPDDDCGYLHCLLNGGPIALGVAADGEAIEQINFVTKLAKKVAGCEMLRHEFLSEDGRVQRTVFADGTEVTVDFEKVTYDVKFGE